MHHLVFLMEYRRFFTKGEIRSLNLEENVPKAISQKKDKFISNYLPVGYDDPVGCDDSYLEGSLYEPILKQIKDSIRSYNSNGYLL